MLPIIKEVERELEIAGELNPGPCMTHSYVLMQEEFDYNPATTDYGFVILKKNLSPSPWKPLVKV